MKKRAPLAFLAILLSAGFALAQQATIPLDIRGGDVKVVKVDKVIVVKVDLTVVSSTPFTISAPPGAGLYFWTLPAGVSGTDKGDTYEIASAPSGQITISVKAIAPNLDKDGRFTGFKTEFGSVTFAMGGVPAPPVVPPVTPPDIPPDVPPIVPPPPVIPPGPPLTQLESDVAAAYAKDTDVGRDAFRKQYAALFRQGIPYANDPSIATSGGLYAKLAGAETVLDKTGDLPKKCLPNTKAVVRAELRRTLELNPLVQFTQVSRDNSAATLLRIAVALEKLK